MTVYRVVAECAMATVDTLYGRAKSLVYKHGLVPGDAPEVPHLLANGMIEPVGGLAPEPGPAPVVEQGGADQKPPVVEVDPEVAAAREAARQKLAESGGVPDGRSADAVLVEYLAANGYEYDELVKTDRAALKELVAQVKAR